MYNIILYSLCNHRPPVENGDPEENRVVGKRQEDDFKIHSHSLTIHASQQGGEGNYIANDDGGGIQRDISGFQTCSTGGKETRPKNAAIYYYIKID